jgi:BirA family biotin operon repressor/biotin-[acetyl-CoA-carboxylase] ligase
MDFALSPRAKTAGYRIAAYDSIGSTNAEALACARAGDRGPLWIVAREQTQGRGRRGRVWQTQNGNLAASLLMSIDVPLAIAATLGLVAGLAVEDALGRLTGLRTRLKWPNDVLAGEQKLAGILLESEPVDHGVGIVIGIGINVISAPPGLPYPATSLRNLGADIGAEPLFTALADSWIDMAGVWNGGRGLARIRQRWLERAAGLGKPASVNLGSAVLDGVFETLDESGRLILRTADGSQRMIAAGDVYFAPRRAAAEPL